MNDRKYRQYKVPSKSEPNSNRLVVHYRKGNVFTCDCPAHVKNCRHIRVVKRYIGYVSGDPDECFYTKDVRQLEEHHLLRASDRKFSLTIFITHWIHKLATLDKKFEKHLTKLALDIMGDRIKKINIEATFKQTSKKMLVSGDLGLQATFQSYDRESADLSDVADRKKMVIVSFTGGEMYALINSVTSSYMKNEKKVRHEIRLESAPAEFVNIIKLEKAAYDGDLKVRIQYDEEKKGFDND